MILWIYFCREAHWTAKSVLPSPPCWVLHNGIGGLNVMTAVSEAHTQHARRPTHTLPNHIISVALLIPPFFLSSFLCILLTQSNPRTFLPFFCLSLFSDVCVLSHSNPSLAFFPFFFYYDKGAAPWTGSCRRPWQQPLQFAQPFTPHQGIAWTPPDPFNLLATPYLQNLL